MPGYRKPHKQEAYEHALGFVSNLSDECLNTQEAFRDTAISIVEFCHGTGLSGNDIRQVAAKAIRVERGRRIGTHDMIKKSFDLSRTDCDMLAKLQDKLGHSTEVATIRAAIYALYARTIDK